MALRIAPVLIVVPWNRPWPEARDAAAIADRVLEVRRRGRSDADGEPPRRDR